MTFSSPTVIPFLAGNYPVESDNRPGGQPIVIKKEPSIQLLSNVIVNYEDNIAPENFQRPESWSKEDRRKFFISLLMDRIEGVIVLVDIEQALHRVLQVSPEDRAVDNIFKPLLEQGYKYIVLDGNNRLQFLTSLLNDKYGIPEGEYGYIRDPQDTSVSTFKVKRGKNKFSDLPPAVQTTLRKRKCIISEYTQIGYDGLSEVFLNTNSGVFPNAQEIRNAFNSPWADYVRALRCEVSPLLGHMFTNYKKRYCGDDWIVDCLDFALQAVEVDDVEGEEVVTCNPISQSTKNKLYRSEFLSESQQTDLRDTFTDLLDFINQLIDEADSKDEVNKIKRKSTIQNLFWMMFNGIVTYQQAKVAVELHEKAYTNYTRTYGDDEATFKIACSGSRKANIEFRYMVLKEIIDEVTTKYPDEIYQQVVDAV